MPTFCLFYYAPRHQCVQWIRARRKEPWSWKSESWLLIETIILKKWINHSKTLKKIFYKKRKKQFWRNWTDRQLPVSATYTLSSPPTATAQGWKMNILYLNWNKILVRFLIPKFNCWGKWFTFLERKFLEIWIENGHKMDFGAKVWTFGQFFIFCGEPSSGLMKVKSLSKKCRFLQIDMRQSAKMCMTSC